MKLVRYFIALVFFTLIQATYANDYLLKPTGKYGVGFQDIPLVNTTVCPDGLYRKNINEKDFDITNKKYCHEIILRVYYPLSKIPKQDNEYYAPYLITLNNWFIKKYNLSKEDVNKLSSILTIRTYTKEDAKSIANKKFPIILFSPGSGSSAQVYTNLISNLVSHGYIVVGINSMFINGPLQKANGYIVQPPDSYLDTVGRVENIKDLRFVLEHLHEIPFKYNLKNHANFNLIGFMGHSRGGMSIVHLLSQNPINKSIKAVVLMDPGTSLGKKNYPISLPNIPALVMWSLKFKTEMQGSTLLEKNIQNFVLKNNQKNMDFSNHNNFCDFSTFQYHPAYANKNIRKELTVGSGNGYEIAVMINNKILSFFNSYLK